MRSRKGSIGLGLMGLAVLGLLAAMSGCDETQVGGYDAYGYYGDDLGGYGSDNDYTGGEVLETYLSNFVVY